jgi:hypothetical protein
MLSNDIINFILGLFVGATIVGSSTQRTISTYDGKAEMAMFSSFMNGIAYFISIKFVAKDNYIGYLGTMVGSILIVGYMAIKHRNKNQ